MTEPYVASPEAGPCDAAAGVLASLAEAELPWFLWVLPDTPPGVVEWAGVIAD